VALRCHWRLLPRGLASSHTDEEGIAASHPIYLRFVGRGGSRPGSGKGIVANLLKQLWNDERGQDIAEYAVMLAVILVIVVGTVRLIGSNANNVFSQVGSAVQ